MLVTSEKDKSNIKELTSSLEISGKFFFVSSKLRAPVVVLTNFGWDFGFIESGKQ